FDAVGGFFQAAKRRIKANRFYGFREVGREMHTSFRLASNLLKINAIIGGGGGGGIFRGIENTEIIEKSTRTELSRIGNCAQLERIWNAGSPCSTRITIPFW